MPLTDVSSELAILSGIFRYGRDAMVDCDELIDSGHFSIDFNQVVYACMKDFYEDGRDRRLDVQSLRSTARKLGLGDLFEQDDSKRHLRAMQNNPVELETVRVEAAKLLKLSIINHLESINDQVGRDLGSLTGDETLNHILSLVENPFFEYSAKLNGENHDTKQIAEGIEDWLEHTIAEETENIGIPTPFPKFNQLIGGGIRRKGVAIIGARGKAGKTVLCDNIAIHVAGTLGIPVLNLDTEMSDDEHWARILGHLTGIPMERIEHGQITPEEADLLREKARWLKTIPYYYRSVIDESFNEQVAAMRRWVIKTVGVNQEGVRNPCLVIYDYLQLTDPGEFAGNNFKEYQILGFQMVALSQLTKKYDIPILSTLQLNRDGIDKETTAAAAGSDRIIWKCTNFSILKRKSEEEMTKDGAKEGNLKLINLIARHGPGGEPGDYINIVFENTTAQMTEGKTRRELDRGKVTSKQKGFEVDAPDETLEFGLQR